MLFPVYKLWILDFYLEVIKCFKFPVFLGNEVLFNEVVA